MSNEITITHTVEQAGIVANTIAARSVFLDYNQRKSANSLKAQRSDLATFATYLIQAGTAAPTVDQLQAAPTAWAGVTWGLVAGFVQWMLRQGLALSSVNRKLSTVKVYAGLAAQAGTISGSELALIKTVKGYAAKEWKRVDEKRTTTRVGTKKESNISIDAATAKQLKQQPSTPQGRRDAVIMALLIDHGLRVGELAELRTTDIHLSIRDLQFYRPKVGKTQTHRLTKDAKQALAAYLPDAPAMGNLLRGSLKNGELSDQGMGIRAIQQRVEELGKVAGIEGLSPHDLRHYWATKAVRRGIDPFRLQQAGGWTSMATVQKYVDETAIANEGMDADE